MRLTLLRPVERWVRTSKSYSAPNRDSKQSDYQLGSQFSFEDYHFTSLQELGDKLRAETRAILISGVPNELAEAMGHVPRQTKFFPYPDDQHTHCFDMDAWKIPAATRDLIKPSLTDPKSMGELVNAMLRNEGFDVIADADKLIVLTSSMWDLDLLNCHIYVSFDKPISVQALREFATALAKVNQRSVFDPAVFKAVQPQFFTPPTCIGFKDPYKESRIFFVPGNGAVNLEAFNTTVTKTLKLADWDPHATEAAQLPPIGTTWLQTIREFVGNERGINEPAHRAAAQLVQSVGRQHVLSNINDFAQQMFDEVWQTIAKKGERGDAKDKATYDLNRFRQYLKSATDKRFGDNVDSMVNQVQDAIEAATQGDITKLTSQPVAQALRDLKAKHYQRYLPLEIAIIKKHKLLGTRQLGQVMKSASDDTMLTGGGGDGFNENVLIDPVLKQYDYVSDHHGNKFAAIPGNGDGGYRMMRIDGDIINVFYNRGLKMSDNQVTANFGRKALSKLLGEEKENSVSIFEQTLIGSRVVPEDQTPHSPTWINLGMQEDGLYKSAKVEADNITLMSHQDSEPRWFWGIPPLELPTQEQIAAKFNGFESMMDFLTEELPKYVCADDDEMMKVIMWICSTYADKSLSYVLELIGQQGSGKSTGADFIKDLVDPSGHGLGRGADRTVFWGINDNFVADIESRYVTIFDNVSKLSAKDQDILCSVCTGLRHNERILYTQGQMSRTIRRPLIFTALSNIITRPDLRSRVVSVEMKRAPFNPNFLSQWAEVSPYLRFCLLQLTAKTLKLYRDITHKPDDIHPRDVFLGCVYSAMKNKTEVDFDYVAQFRLREAWEVSYDSPFVSIFSRYLKSEYDGQQSFQVTTRALFDKVKKWCLQNAGKEIDGYTIDMMSMSAETPGGMGWQISKHMDVIEKITPWKVERKERLANGTRYHWTKKVDTLQNLL